MVGKEEADVEVRGQRLLLNGGADGSGMLVNEAADGNERTLRVGAARSNEEGS